MKKILVFSVLTTVLLCAFSFAAGEETEPIGMIVTATRLNGRANPSKRASIEARFDLGDMVEALRWSKNHHWVEVKGGETGTVWIWWEYLTEREDEYWAINDWGSRVKIRKEPFGTVTGYLKKDGEVVIDRVLFGWGHCKRGWIDLKYLTEED